MVRWEKPSNLNEEIQAKTFWLPSLESCLCQIAFALEAPSPGFIKAISDRKPYAGSQTVTCVLLAVYFEKRDPEEPSFWCPSEGLCFWATSHHRESPRAMGMCSLWWGKISHILACSCPARPGSRGVFMGQASCWHLTFHGGILSTHFLLTVASGFKKLPSPPPPITLACRCCCLPPNPTSPFSLEEI